MAGAALAAGGWKAFLGNGFKGSIGGEDIGVGSVFGTPGFQDIKIDAIRGDVTFDPSFNGGGDVIREWWGLDLAHPDAASAWHASAAGSSLVLDNAHVRLTIPVGLAGTSLVFSATSGVNPGSGSMVFNDARILAYDEARDAIMLGSQQVTGVSTVITALPEGSPIPDHVDPAARASLVLAGGEALKISGNFTVYGTPAAEAIEVGPGNVVFDPSFSRGGDSIFFLRQEWTARAVGSNLVLEDDAGNHIQIPVGTEGIAIGNPYVSETLVYDTGRDVMLIGDTVITSAGVNVDFAVYGMP